MSTKVSQSHCMLYQYNDSSCKQFKKMQPTAHEHRAWLVFYSIPVLLRILNLEYIRHLALFVEALWLLLQTSISQDDLTCADKLLVQFCKQFSSLYGIYKALWYTLNMELCPISSLFSGKKHVSKCPPTASLHWQCKTPWPFVGTQYLSIWKCEWNVSESLPWQSHSWCAGASLTKA